MCGIENEDIEINNLPESADIERFALTMPKEERWENLGIANDFMFFKIMQDTELALTLLRLLLPALDIERIVLLETQKTIDEFLESRGVRFDIYAKTDSRTVHNVEMQTSNTGDLPRRARFNRSISDVGELSKGAKSYNELPNIFVIFICTFDIFGAGKCVYTFRNLCIEDTSIEMKDGSTTIFINASAADADDDISNELRAFLRFVMGRSSDDPFVRRLESALKDARHDAKWRREYMFLRMRDKKNFYEGRAEGISIGEARGIISMGRELGAPDSIIAGQLMSKLHMPAAEAQRMLTDFAQA